MELEPCDKMNYRESAITIMSESSTYHDEDHVETPTNGTNSIYVSKKTIAQGMFDVALLSSNTNQLVHLISSQQQDNKGHFTSFHITAITLLIMSIILQVIVGGCLITITVMTRPNDTERKASLKRLSNISTILIFFITILNVIIPSFTPTMVYREV